MTTYNIVCTGGRDYADSEQVELVLDLLLQARGSTLRVYVGDARGADWRVREWCRASLREEQWRVYMADWDQHGRSAGLRRNGEMLDEARPHLVIAFPGGRGTDHCVREARKRDIPVLFVGR